VSFLDKKITVAITRGNKKWFVKATSTETVKNLCKEKGWEFDSIVDVPQTDHITRWCKNWRIGKLIREIGEKNEY